jgi:hypothetical protein
MNVFRTTEQIETYISLVGNDGSRSGLLHLVRARCRQNISAPSRQLDALGSPPALI